MAYDAPRPNAALGRGTPFNLEHAIATWRRFMASTHALIADDIDELESHLREEIEEALASGNAPSVEAAYHYAVRRIGDFATVDEAYRHVFWDKIFYDNLLLRELHWRTLMLRNYLKTTFRGLKRRPAFSLINIFGLALGMTACLLIARYVQHEWSYDRFHVQAEQIVRVNTHTDLGPEHESAATIALYGPMLEQALPEVLKSVRLQKASFSIVQDDRRFEDIPTLFADTTLFDVFSFDLQRGNPATALSEPFSLVLTQEAARRHFGSADPIGQTLNVNGEVDATVTGVLAPIPAASHLTFDMLVSMSTSQQVNAWLFNNWYSTQFHTYLLLPENADQAALQTKLNTLVQQRAASDLLNRYPNYHLAVEPLLGIYLFSDKIAQIGPTGNRTYLYLFTVIGVFVLLIACINFMNLSTARSAERGKEVGVRKMVGAQRIQLGSQFLSESLLLSFLAVGVAALLFHLMLPFLSGFTGKDLSLTSQDYMYGLGFLYVLGLGVGMLSGSYPALVLSSFSPISVLKGRLESSMRGAGLRRVLVVFQFGISIALIAATLVVFAQLRYLAEQPLGFDKEQLVLIDFPGNAVGAQSSERAKAAFLQHPAVQQATASLTSPMGEGFGRWNITVENAGGEMQEASIPNYPIDFDFLDTYGIEVVAGRPLSESYQTDFTEALIVNEAAVAHFGYARPEDILGKRFETWPRGGTVVGVIRDFNFQSLHESIAPLTMRYLPSQYGTLSLRLNTANLGETMQDLEGIWKSLKPDFPFSYQFLDDTFAAQHARDQALGNLFTVFAALAIFIASLGLFGLATFTIQKRTKEIGIRKALGASSTSITVLLSKDFVKLVVISFVVGAPIAYFGMQSWLDTFAYHISVSPLLLGLAGGLAVLIALVTVSTQSLQAAAANPVDALHID